MQLEKKPSVRKDDKSKDDDDPAKNGGGTLSDGPSRSSMIKPDTRSSLGKMEPQVSPIVPLTPALAPSAHALDVIGATPAGSIPMMPGMTPTDPYKRYPHSSDTGYSKNKEKEKIPKKEMVNLGNGRFLDPDTKWGKFSKFMLDYYRWMNYILAVLWIIIYCCFLISALKYTKLVRGNDVWTLSTEPNYHDFDDYSISSSSEMCNEIARMVLIEQHLPFDGIPLLMHACLFIAEPHASGLGGDSVVLYGGSGECEQVNGIGHSQENWVKMVTNRFKNDPFSLYQGPYSVRFPGDSLTMLGVAKKVYTDLNRLDNKAKSEKFQIVSSVFRNEFFEENLHFAVSYRVSQAISKTAVSTLAIMVGDHFLKDEHHHFRQEGELYPIPQKALETFNPLFMQNIKHMDHLIDRVLDSYKDMMNKAMFYEGDEALNVFNSFFHDRRPQVATQMVKTIRGHYQELENGLWICAPIPDKRSDAPPLVATLLEKYKKDKDSKNEEEIADDTRPDLKAINAGFYVKLIDLYSILRKEIYKAYQTTSDLLSEPLAKKLNKLYKSNAKDLERLNADRRYVVGNSFALIDHKNRRAVAMTASLGSPFGSLISDGEGVILNNHQADMYRHGNKSRLYMHVHEAIIITNGPQPHTVYAGLPGMTYQSLDIPRKATSLALSVFYEMPLETALTAPLVWLNDTHALYKGAVPFGYTNRFADKMREFVPKATSAPETRVLLDEAVAVQGKRAIAFTMDEKGRGMVMPNGV